MEKDNPHKESIVQQLEKSRSLPQDLAKFSEIVTNLNNRSQEAEKCAEAALARIKIAIARSEQYSLKSRK